MPSLKEILDSYMRRVSGLDVYCSRCLRTERWGGCVVLMVVDAAFTSIGLNYFTAVVPKVEEFSKRFVENGRIRNLKELAEADINELREVWKNRRSWAMAKGIASYLSTLSEDDKQLSGLGPLMRGLKTGGKTLLGVLKVLDCNVSVS
jgi:hypothetical protein